MNERSDSPDRSSTDENRSPTATSSCLLSVFKKKRKDRHHHHRQQQAQPLMEQPLVLTPRHSSALKLLSHLRSSVHRRKSQQRQVQRAAINVEHNVMHFLSHACPLDVIPKILAFAGPRMTQTLSKVNRFWKDFINEEETWKVMCIDLYKWKEGDAAEPKSWKRYYATHPCVPTDYFTIKAALSCDAVSRPVSRRSKKPHAELVRDVTVLLRPGRYRVQESISIHAVSRQVSVTLKTLELPPETSQEVDVLEALLYPRETKAVILTQSRRRNEPCIRLVRGQLCLENLILLHQSSGTDIWNGNAAVYIQPQCRDQRPATTTPDDQNSPRATARLDRVEISSDSGRGLVVIDGGVVHMKDCYIHDCAATGIYVGGRNTVTSIEQSDICCNGLGNRRTGGIARGHSGVYVEQGDVTIANCNVCENTASGISVISQDQAQLLLKDSDVLSNGFGPLDISHVAPSLHQIHENNRIAVVGVARARSSILKQKIENSITEWSED